MPYAPEYRFSAWTFQLLSLAQSGSRYRNCRFDQWNRCSSLTAIWRAVRAGFSRPDGPWVAASWLLAGSAVAKNASSSACCRCEDDSGEDDGSDRPGSAWTAGIGRTWPAGLATAAGWPAVLADHAPTVPPTTATMATAGPVTARWNLTAFLDLIGLLGAVVLTLDKRNLLSGAVRRSAFTRCHGPPSVAACIARTCRGYRATWLLRGSRHARRVLSDAYFARCRPPWL